MMLHVLLLMVEQVAITTQDILTVVLAAVEHRITTVSRELVVATAEEVRTGAVTVNAYLVVVDLTIQEPICRAHLEATALMVRWFYRLPIKL